MKTARMPVHSDYRMVNAFVKKGKNAKRKLPQAYNLRQFPHCGRALSLRVLQNRDQRAQTGLIYLGLYAVCRLLQRIGSFLESCRVTRRQS